MNTSITNQNRMHRLLITELPSVRRRARRLCPRPHDVEDLVQETYLRALQSLNTFRLSELGPRPWLLTILRNLFCSRYASRRREQNFLRRLRQDPHPLSSEIIIRQHQGSPVLSWEDVDERVKQAVDSLTPAARETFLLSAVDGLKYREIAAATDAPLGTVMVRLHRARAHVAAHLNLSAPDQRGTRRKRHPQIL
jgi:RNA polymerase sigma-70 factor (ECF subfamily)